MFRRRISFRAACAISCLVAGLSFGADKGDKKAKTAADGGTVGSGNAVLWTDPDDIATRDLFYGPGGKKHEPKGPFKFVKEDLDGTNPKFSVKDGEGKKWKVKLGIESRPETVASRIVWAVGYQANDDYFLADLQVDGMPAKLHRGQDQIGPNGTMHNVRLKRENEKKLGQWAWKNNPFSGTRELNGLRTLMAVINNWDLKDENNAIYEVNGQRVFMISDLGASFGCADRCWPRDEAKGDLTKYQESKFIKKSTADAVSFETPGREGYLYAVNPKEYVSRIHLEWIGENIPRADARWMGTMLAKLTPDQIHDAFRAAGYSADDIDGFSKVLMARIAELTAL